MAKVVAEVARWVLPELIGAIFAHEYDCDPSNPNEFCNPESVKVENEKGELVPFKPPPGSFVRTKDGKMIQVPPEGYDAVRDAVIHGLDAIGKKVDEDEEYEDDSVVQRNEAMPKDYKQKRLDRERGFRSGPLRPGDPMPLRAKDVPGTTREFVRYAENGYHVERVCVPKGG